MLWNLLSRLTGEQLAQPPQSTFILCCDGVANGRYLELDVELDVPLQEGDQTSVFVTSGDPDEYGVYKVLGRTTYKVVRWPVVFPDQLGELVAMDVSK